MDVIIDYFGRIATYNLWVVTIELILIGLVIYWVVDFLEGTRGERLFRGVLFILVAGVLVLNLLGEQFGQFERLNYLFTYFLIFVLVIAVAAFQPEIRRALIRIGRPGFMIGSSRQLAKTVEEIVTAVSDMSANKTGAIIVIEKKVALGEFIESGVRIESQVSAELLKSIFYPNSPLHDMAVVIRGDKIAAARVQLPLAEAGSIDGFQLGSRHRAAIGITSGSDATVIVVSEETGIISIAQSGKLIRKINESQLRMHLNSTMGEVAPLLERFRKKKNEGQEIKTG